MKIELIVEGMSCQNCVRHVREAALAVAGVSSAEVDLSAGRATLEAEGDPTDAVIAALDDEGYPARRA